MSDKDIANPDIVHISAIEGLLSEINANLGMIVANNPEQHQVRLNMIEALAGLQSDELFELRRAFE